MGRQPNHLRRSLSRPPLSCARGPSCPVAPGAPWRSSAGASIAPWPRSNAGRCRCAGAGERESEEHLPRPQTRLFWPARFSLLRPPPLPCALSSAPRGSSRLAARWMPRQRISLSRLYGRSGRSALESPIPPHPPIFKSPARAQARGRSSCALAPAASPPSFRSQKNPTQPPQHPNKYRRPPPSPPPPKTTTRTSWACRCCFTRRR